MPCLNYLLTFLCNQNTIQILPHQMRKPAFGLCLFPTSILLPTLPSLYFSHGELFFCAIHPGELYILYIFNIYLIKERENLNSPRLTHFFFFFCMIWDSLFDTFFFKIFLRWTIFKVSIEFVTILLLFYILFFWLRDMWDLSSTTSSTICIPCTGW